MKRKTVKFKELKSLIGVVAAIALLASCGEKKKQAPVAEKESPAAESVAPGAPETAGVGFDTEELNAFFTRYVDLQQALVASDPGKAEAISREMSQLSLQGMPDVTEAVAALAASDHLGQQRAIFFRLNKALAPYLEAHLNSGEIYQQYCPMAFENTGAFWFSDSEEILNPYFGDAMLRCGAVEKTYSAL